MSVQLAAQAEQERRRRKRERAAIPAPSLIEWAARYRRIDDRPFSLARFKPLEAIYADDHPNKVVIKPAQKGVSEWAITLACWALDVGARYWGTEKDGLNVGYLFPTQASLHDFGKERFSGLRVETDHLAGLFTDYDDVGFKQAKQSYLYLRGAWSTKALKSFPADLLIYDEFDEMDPSAVALARKRLNASPLKRQVAISTPTLPGRGIHAAYVASDQRVWEVHCPGCDVWSGLDFFRDVRANGQGWEEWRYWDDQRLRAAEITLACPSCKIPLDRLGPGRWTAQRPEVTGARGYQVPALCFPMVSLLELALSAIKDDPGEVTEFYRSDLGLPFEASGSRITETMLAALSHELAHHKLPENVTWRDTTMGVDVGSRHHYRISSIGPGGFRYVLRMGAVREWESLSMLLEQYKVRRCVIDALPELHACEAWAAKHKGIVIRAYYPNSANLKGHLFQPDANKIEDIVHINRTMAMDKVFANVANANERWPKSIHDDPEVIAHMKAPVRIVSADDRGQERASWEHTAPDHYFHSSVYDTVAAETLPAPPRPRPQSRSVVTLE